MRSDTFGRFATRSDTFGRIWTGLELSGRDWTFSRIFGNFDRSFVFRDFGEVLEEREANGPQDQLLHQILLQIHPA